MHAGAKTEVGMYKPSAVQGKNQATQQSDICYWCGQGSMLFLIADLKMHIAEAIIKKVRYKPYVAPRKIRKRPN